MSANQTTPCSYYLPFSGCGSDLPGNGDALLGVQIIGLVLIGFCFALLGSFGVFWILDNTNRKRRLTGVAIAIGCIPMVVFFYTWGAIGYPMALWRLWE